jgi:hypothetical protein
MMIAMFFNENAKLDPLKEQTGYPYGFGLGQIEEDTFQTVRSSSLYEEFINSSEAYEDSQGNDLRASLRELKRIFPFNKRAQEAWNLKKARNSPLANPQVQILLTLLSWENVLANPHPVEEVSAIKKSLAILNEYKMKFSDNDTALLLLDNYDDILEHWPFSLRLSRDEKRAVILLSAHKTGPRRGFFDLLDIGRSVTLDNGLSAKELAAYFKNEHIRALEMLTKENDAAWRELKEFFANPKNNKGVGAKTMAGLLDFRNKNGRHYILLEYAAKTLLKERPGSLDEFASLYEKYIYTAWRLWAEKDRGPGNVKSKIYVFLTRVLRGEIGDAAEAIKKENVGGIDLSEQDKAMDVLGDSGTFGLDLSPEQMKKMDQDLRGFMPLIIHVQPVKDVKMFLGVGS